MKFRSAQTTFWLAALSASLFVAGCTGTSPKEAEKKPETPEVAADANAPAVSPSEKPALDLATLPAELKNDAYAYYGLGRTSPMTLKVKAGETESVGSQSVKFVEMADGKATFVIKNGDALSAMGDNTVTLEAGGIKVLSSDRAKTNPDEWELPSGLTPGKSWKTTSELNTGTDSVKITLTNKVVGMEKVKTDVAEYTDALFITASGGGERNGKKLKMETKSWFVKDRGAVKVEITTTMDEGKSEVVTLEESKSGQ